MAQTTRVVADPSQTGRAVTSADGQRVWVHQPGAVLDLDSGDFWLASSNGWTRCGDSSGARPDNAPRGHLHLDAELGRLIVFDGANWRDPATGEVA